MLATTDKHFWEPIRKSIFDNFIRYGVGLTPIKLPVVTYISRQLTRRRLTEESHTSLVSALEELQAEGICEVHVAQMEKMTLHEQLELMFRSTVGVAGLPR